MRSLVLIGIIFSLAGCGAGTRGSHSALVEGMRNDCNMSLGRELAADGYPLGKFDGSAVSLYKKKSDGTYGWYPLSLFSLTSDFSFGFSKTTTGPGKDDRCDLIADLFTTSLHAGIRRELTFEYKFAQFPFPVNTSDIPAEPTVIPASAKGELVWVFRTATGESIGAPDLRVPAELQCETPFAARRTWEAGTDAGQDASEQRLCRTEGSQRLCLQFVAEFGDKCDFKVTRGQFWAPPSRSFKATLGGRLVHLANGKGYTVSVTAFELD